MDTRSNGFGYLVAGILLLLPPLLAPAEDACAGDGAVLSDPGSTQDDPYGGAVTTTTTTSSTTTTIPSHCHFTALAKCDVRATRRPRSREPRDRFSARCLMAAEPPLGEPLEDVHFALTREDSACSTPHFEYAGTLERTSRCWRLPRETRPFSGLRHLKLCAVSGSPGVYRLSARGRRMDLQSPDVPTSYAVDVSIGNDCGSPCSSTTTSTTTPTTTSTTVPPTACINAAGGPSLLRLRVNAGSELDLGWQGLAHNQELPRGSEMRVCLSDCDLDSNPVCTGLGSTGAGDDAGVNGRTFGPPMPFDVGGVPVCVSSVYRDDVHLRRLDLRTGEIDLDVPLILNVHQGSVVEPPCPICDGLDVIGSPGTCTGGPNHGRPCVVEGLGRFGNVSSDCPPAPQNSVGETPVDLHLGTGTAILPGDAFACVPPPSGSGGRCPCAGQRSENQCSQECSPASCPSDIESGIDQQCCVRDDTPDDLTLPCFGGDVVRSGVAAPFFADPVARSGSWPDPAYSKSAGVTLASTFCMGPTASNIVNTVVGLGGPGALLLSSTLTVERLCRGGDRGGLGCSRDEDCPGGCVGRRPAESAGKTSN